MAKKSSKSGSTKGSSTKTSKQAPISRIQQSKIDREAKFAAQREKKAQTAPTPDKPTPVKTFTQPGRIDVKDTKTGKIKHVTQQMIDRSKGQYVPISDATTATTTGTTYTGKQPPRLNDFYAQYGRGQEALDAYRQAQRDFRAGKTTEVITETPTEEAVSADTANQSALDIINNSNLPDDLKSLFAEVVQGWDPAQDINTENILSSFENIKSTTVDPYFSKLVDQYTTDIKTARDQLVSQRERELEIERINAENSLKSAQAGLEASGLTFSGQGVEQLGATSAYAQNAGESVATPTQELFGGAFVEGAIPQASRLIASGSESAYTSNLQKLGRSAEDILGSTTAQTLGIGFAPVGGVTGSLESQKQQSLASLLSSLYGQGQQNYGYSQPITYDFGNL